MTLIDLANPTRFLTLTARILPWLAAATATLLLIGLYHRQIEPSPRLPTGATQVVCRGRHVGR